jgi:hypothetical protein
MHAAIIALYGARIEATRRSLPGRDIAAAVQALHDEQRSALQALAVRKQAAQRAGREQRAAERFSDRLVDRQRVRAQLDARPS